jgi:hypothetical protein
MSPINHKAGLTGLNTDQPAEVSLPVHSPRPAGGVHTPTHCGPASEGQQELITPQAILGLGPPGGLGDGGSLGGALIKSYLYKGDDISPHISPSAEVSASAKTQKTSMAARIREYALAAKGTFTVDEIASVVVKSSPISPHPATPEEWQPWRKQVSNEMGRLFKQGVLVREKNGTYRRVGTLPETDQAAVVDKNSILETYQVDAEGQMANWTALRESCRTDFSETSSEPLPLDLPLNLGNDFYVFQGNEILIGGAKNAGKTLFAIEFMRLNMDKMPCTYINSEMRGGELKNRLTDLGQAYGIAFEEFKAKIEFFDCRCNALSKGDMNQLEALLNPNGCNIIDYVKVTDDFFKVGECLERIHARLRKGIAIIFFQKKPKADELLGGHHAAHLPRTVILLDYDLKTQVRRLSFEKVKFPARENYNPESATIYYDIVDKVRLVRKA